jgi:nucleoid DNA-binding protein
LDALADDLAKGTEVRLTDFGTFTVRERKARMGRNPRTGVKITIAASRFPAFKASKKLKDKVAQPQPQAQGAPA